MAREPSPAPRPRMAAARRRSVILRAAREAFADRGYHGAGTAAIARAAGCSEAVLYRHFPSKRALLAAVLAEEVRGVVEEGRLLRAPEGARTEDGEPPAPAGLADVLAARLAEPEFVRTIRLVLLAIGTSEDPEVNEAVRGAFEAVRRPLAAALAQARERGEVDGDLDPEALTWLWHGVFLVTAVRRSVRDDGVAEGGVEAARLLARLAAPPAGPGGSGPGGLRGSAG